jgi:transposase-like protein
MLTVFERFFNSKTKKMANLEQLPPKTSPRITRYFSEEFKKKKVTELDKKVTTIAEICREYTVSPNAVYKWIYKFSLMKKKSIKMVIEADSDTAKIQALKQHILDLEQLLGKKQFEVEFLQKQMQIASEQFGIDLKKKLSGKPSAGSGSKEDSTATK